MKPYVQLGLLMFMTIGVTPRWWFNAALYEFELEAAKAGKKIKHKQ